jgi:hypothetical protein
MDEITQKHLDDLRFDDKERGEAIGEKALGLIEIEEDLKYRKKNASLWRDR